jgi:hypothetical protein
MLAVIYLARGIGGGLASAQAFFESYGCSRAGVPHDLIVVMKGWDCIAGQHEVLRLAEAHAATIVHLPDDGYDWGAYMRVAGLLPHDWLCFLNTHSRIMSQDWLAKMHKAAEQPMVGAAGATASLGSMLPAFNLFSEQLRGIRYRKGLLKAAAATVYFGAAYPIGFVKHVWRFSGMPNPHLRSNAFLVRRRDFIAYCKTTRIPRSKNDTLVLEHGKMSLTRFLQASGRVTVVVDANGQAYPPESWVESGTFWVPGQPNLLIADNKTRYYDDAGAYSRRFLELAAWGRVFTPKPVPR